MENGGRRNSEAAMERGCMTGTGGMGDLVQAGGREEKWEVERYSIS